MHNTANFKYGVFDDMDATGLKIFYKNSRISFLILLPNKRTGLKRLEAKLKDVNLIELEKRMGREYVSVSLPKFCVEYEIDMDEPLQKVRSTFVLHFECDCEIPLTEFELFLV